MTDLNTRQKTHKFSAFKRPSARRFRSQTQEATEAKCSNICRYFSLLHLLLACTGWLKFTSGCATQKPSLMRFCGILGSRGGGAKFAEPSDLVKDLAQQPGSKVAAIKAHREQTGLDLKAANEVIEQLVRAAEQSKSP